ncbi:MAG: hypothetical protein AB7T49_17610 [Oligoflexales bacterium]
MSIAPGQRLQIGSKPTSAPSKSAIGATFGYGSFALNYLNHLDLGWPYLSLI